MILNASAWFKPKQEAVDSRYAEQNAQALCAAKDEWAKNLFIEQSMPFIQRSLSRHAKKPIGPSDEEWSVGLVAYAEAIDGYRSDKGDFAAWAHLVIAKRLTDHYRRVARTRQEIGVAPHVFTGDVDAGEDAMAYAVHAAIQPVNQRDGLHDELEAVSDTLGPYGFTFMELTACSPQTAKTRQACACAAAYLLSHPAILQDMGRKRTLPAKRLHDACGIPTKLLDRHRKYIIAITLIMEGDYPYLQEYLHLIRKEMKT